jgi:hypothetical protein
MCAQITAVGKPGTNGKTAGILVPATEHGYFVAS